MALFVADGNIETNIDQVLWEDWKVNNDDGFGYFAMKEEQNADGTHKTILHRQKKVNRFVNYPIKQLFVLHCRAATGGKGQHPFVSCDPESRILLVHNGMVNNYTDLKKELESHGHKFATEIDSEILLHAWEYVCDPLKNGFEKMFTKRNVEDFIKFLNSKKISGSINFIIIDKISQQWLAFSDGSLHIGKPMNPVEGREFWLVASELDPLNDHKEKPMKMLSIHLDSGQFIIGNKTNLSEIFKIDTLRSQYYYTNNTGAIKAWAEWDKRKKDQLKKHVETLRKITHDQLFYLWACTNNCCQLDHGRAEGNCIYCNQDITILTPDRLKKRLTVCSEECMLLVMALCEAWQINYTDLQSSMFPLCKTGESLCTKCHQVMTENDICHWCMEEEKCGSCVKGQIDTGGIL